ncbi:ankyrin repeat domain-containing protein [Nonlabens antarcticus]|uniref:ankyrin repeat domain-containing protein n=1 Tax=Nonlabens antarcticus TaxID=392714 RepID=UPI001891200D|nr:ankyrin repeat domain-containing protein [Nonlabens antarcticus]
MNRIFYSLLIALMFTGSAFAQDNVFLDRDFWKSNPDLTIVKEKNTAGNDAIAMNSNGYDATTYAILGNASDDVIKYLLTLDGNGIDKKTHDSRIYLHWAAYTGNLEIVKTLLNKGSSLTALESHGNTPLTYAANGGNMDPELYNLFMKQGIKLADEKNDEGANTLLLAAPSMSSFRETAFFTDNGIDINSNDKDGNGIFSYAAKKGNISFLKELIAAGVDYKSANMNGGNAFIFAAQGARGHSNTIEIYQFLKQSGLNPNVITKDGYTPLHALAYSNTDVEIFNFFLREGADVNQKDAEGNTPFLNAAYRNNLEIVELLSTDVKDFNLSNKNGQTAMMLATKRNTANVLSFVISETGKDFKPSDAAGNTPAYYLARSYNKNNTEDFKAKLDLLVALGVDMSATQANENTLYHIAAAESDLELLKELSGYKVPVNATNEEGLTALHIAAMRSDNVEMMKYLISLGADTSITTDFEETAYDLAGENELLNKQQTALEFLK